MKTLAVVLTLVLSVSFAPSVALAAVNMGEEANSTCTEAAFYAKKPCRKVIPEGGQVVGVCFGVGVCKALNIISADGTVTPVDEGFNILNFIKGVPGDIAKGGYGMIIGTVVAGIKTSLFGGPEANRNPNTGTTQCTGYYRVTVRTSDPCAIYVPPTPSLQVPQNTSKQLLDALKGPSIGDALLQQANKVSAPNPVPATAGQNQTPSVQSGAKGNIQLTSTSATIQAGVRDAARNTESVGFFGANLTQSSSLQGLIERMCLLRPWQNPQISYGIPTSLFDNLCASKGLRVGVLPGAATPALPPASAQAKVMLTATSTVPANPPKVDIWAVPASVAVGSRTSIFWNTKGAESCALSSSDGTFSAGTVSGNSASSPLTGPTFFFISCTAQDGSRANGYVKVGVSNQ